MSVQACFGFKKETSLLGNILILPLKEKFHEPSTKKKQTNNFDHVLGLLRAPPV
jgi:hypothetical protein